MKLVSWNIMHGEIVTPAAVVDSVVALAKSVQELDPDLIGLQEVDYGHPRTENINQTQNIAETLGAQWWAFAPSFYVVDGKEKNVNHGDLPIITNEKPETISAYGISIVSRVPVKKWLRLNLSPALFGKFITIPIAGVRTRIYARDHSRSAIAALLENRVIINTHLSFIWPFNFFQYRKVLKWANSLEQEFSLPVIVMGDFNLKSIGKRGRWKLLFAAQTFPIWEPDRQIDYFLAKQSLVEGFTRHSCVSDHLAIGIYLA